MTDEFKATELARMIDISAVQTFHDSTDVAELARVARSYRFIAAHVLPGFVPLLKQQLTGSDTLVGAPVGFPSGGSSTRIKLMEARDLVEAGVQEMDLMMNVGRLRSKDKGYVLDEIRAAVDAVAPVPIKVILEIHYLTDEEIKVACEMCISGGAAFVKTSTGWAPSGATLDRVELITRFVGDAIKVKASGGIRDLDTVENMLALGVTRFGINTDAAIAIVSQCQARYRSSELNVTPSK
jgi:deoxyribose-phosphate aldolase